MKRINNLRYHVLSFLSLGAIKFAFLIIFISAAGMACSADMRFANKNDTQKRYQDKNDKFKEGQVLKGISSYYAKKFHGRKTANGEIFDMYALTAAHKTLPFNTVLLIINKSNDKQVRVRINDRGPFKKGRILDLSYAAAKKIDMIKTGTAEIEATIIKLGQ